MEDEIFEVAKLVTGAPEDEWDYLRRLCRTELEQVQSKLRDEAGGGALDAVACAVAWLAAADYYCGKGGGAAASWTAGEVSVRERDAAAFSAAAENLRGAARRLLEGVTEDGGFAFLGVRG